jgi:phage gpG-like protein
MAGDGIEYSSGGTRVRIEGLKAVLSKLNKAGADAQDMKDLMHEVGSIVVRAAQPPVLSGTLAGSIRAGRGKTKAVVRAGFASIPYAGVQHYGWPAHGIAPHPFLTDALRANHAQVFAALEAGIDELLAKNGLK